MRVFISVRLVVQLFPTMRDSAKSVRPLFITVLRWARSWQAHLAITANGTIIKQHM